MVKVMTTPSEVLVTKNRASETIHFRMAALAGPSAGEKLARATRYTEFWLTQLAPRTVHDVPINRNGRFGSVFHIPYVGGGMERVKAQDDAVPRCSYWR